MTGGGDRERTPLEEVFFRHAAQQRTCLAMDGATIEHGAYGSGQGPVNAPPTAASSGTPARRAPVTGGGVEIARRAAREAQVPEEWATDPALWALLMKESSTTPERLNTTAQNPDTTAFGMFQFLNKTWEGKPYAKTDDAYKQFVNGFVYIKNRYKTPARAWAFHQRNNFY